MNAQEQEQNNQENNPNTNQEPKSMRDYLNDINDNEISDDRDNLNYEPENVDNNNNNENNNPEKNDNNNINDDNLNDNIGSNDENSKLNSEREKENDYFTLKDNLNNNDNINDNNNKENLYEPEPEPSPFDYIDNNNNKYDPNQNNNNPYANLFDNNYNNNNNNNENFNNINNDFYNNQSDDELRNLNAYKSNNNKEIKTPSQQGVSRQGSKSQIYTPKRKKSDTQLKLSQIILYSITSICIIDASLIFFLNLFQFFKYPNGVSLSYMLLCIFSVVILSFGIFAIYQYTKLLYRCETNFDQNQEKSPERENFNLFGFFLIILFAGYLYSIISFSSFHSNSFNLMEALGQDKKSWEKIFQSLNYAEAHKSVDNFFVSILIMSLIMVGLLALLILYLHIKIGNFIFQKISNQFVCIILFFLNCTLLHNCLCLIKLQKIINLRNDLPIWVFWALLVISSIGIVVYFIGIFANFFNSKKFLDLFASILGFFSLIMFFGSLYAVLLSVNFQSEFDGNCKSLLQSMPREFLIKEKICQNKYAYTSGNMSDMSKCPKNRIISAWDLNPPRENIPLDKNSKDFKENNSTQKDPKNLIETRDSRDSKDSKDTKNIEEKSLAPKEDQETNKKNYYFRYGCLDSLCCESSYLYLREKTQNSALLASFIFLFSVICCLCSFYLTEKLDTINLDYSYHQFHEINKEKDNFEYDKYSKTNKYLTDNLESEDLKISYFSKSNIFLFFGILIAITVLIIFCINLPKEPRSNMDMTKVNSPSLETFIPEKLVVYQNLNKISEDRKYEIIKEYQENYKLYENRNCRVCPTIIYRYDISSRDGDIIVNDKKDFTSIIVFLIKKDEDYNSFVFESLKHSIINYTEYFNFEYMCPLLPSFVYVKISASVYPPMNSDESSRDNNDCKQREESGNNSENSFIQMQGKTFKNSNSIANANRNKILKAKELSKDLLSSNSMAKNSNKNLYLNTNLLENKENLILNRLSDKDLYEKLTKNFKKSSAVTEESYYKNDKLKHSTTINFSKLNVGTQFDVLLNKIDFSFVEDNNFKIQGKLIKKKSGESHPIKGGKIYISNMDFDNCKSDKILSDSEGNFMHDKLNFVKKGYKARYNVTIDVEGLMKYHQIVTSGGIGRNNKLDLGTIELIEKTYLITSKLDLLVLDSIKNEILTDVKVSLYDGYADFGNKMTNDQNLNYPKNLKSFVQTNSNSNANNNLGNLKDLKGNEEILLQLKHLDLKGVYETNDEGYFTLSNLSPGQYTIVLEKEGYYKEVYYLYEIGSSSNKISSLVMTPEVKTGQLRVVLSWPDAPSDLDLYSYFRTTTYTACTVFFGENHCNHLILNADNNKGGRKGAETITLNLQQNFIYTFVARKYIDKSNGHLENEIRVEGAPEIIYNKPKKSRDIPMDKSKAKISFYGFGFSQKIFEINIPENIDKENLVYPEEEFDRKNDDQDFNWWLAFCFDGSQGVKSIKIVNKLSRKEPDFTFCENLYFNKDYNFPTPKPENWDKLYRKDDDRKDKDREDKGEEEEKRTAFIEFEVDEDNEIRRINEIRN